MNKELCQKAYELRTKGNTYPAVAKKLKVSVSQARLMVSINDIMQSRQELWTDGLNSRAAWALRNAGYKSKDEVVSELAANPQKILDCQGMGVIGIRHLKRWIKSSECGDKVIRMGNSSELVE